MNNILKENQPLSYYLVNAIDRVKEKVFSKTDSSIRHTLNTWKNIALEQEQQIKELKEKLVYMHNDGSKQFVIGEQKQKIEGMEQKIQEQKGLLESALAIAKRNGVNTYWKGFIERVKKSLNKD